MPYIREQMLPELAAAAFHARGRRRLSRAGHGDRTIRRRCCIDRIRVRRSIRVHADATAALFGRMDSRLLLRRPPRPPIWRQRLARQERHATAQRRADWSSRARDRRRVRTLALLVQHQSGSLEAAVARARRRNLAISFGVLLLLTVSIALLAATSRRAQRLARQQMEFVAGVSHELRTPVAVIRSAAENLVAWRRRQRRSREALRSAARDRSAAPRRDGRARAAVRRASSRASATGARVAAAHRRRSSRARSTARCRCSDRQTCRCSATSPRICRTVIGDAAALRSAVQNLIANAVKYGGRDRWVGIRAEHARRATPSGGAHHRQRSRRRHSGVRAAAHLRAVLPRRRRRRAPDSRQRARPLARQTHRRRPRRPRDA